MKLGFVGGGAMGKAIIASVLSKGVAQVADISACDIVADRRRYLAEKYGVKATAEPAEAVSGSDIAVLSVKPQEFEGAAKGLAGKLSGGQTVMSIMAGVPISRIRAALEHEAVVRAMPNTPAQIGEGMTVWTATEAVSEDARRSVGEVLAALGRELYVVDEKYIDMATAVSSSGPGYVFLVIEALIDAAVHIGLRRDMAEEMVIQTVLGSARYAQATGKQPAALRNQVTSPGGTTTEGLLALEQAGIRAAFTEAVEAAYEKAKAMGG
jgi:pyrroline-5-carboxylate reductase